MDTQPSKFVRLFIFGHPRTRTNLFCRLWQNHKDVLEWQYPFMQAWVYGPERQEIRERVLAPGKLEEHVKDSFQAGLDALQEMIATAEAQDKVPMVKEHVYHMMDAISLCAHLSLSCEGKSRPLMVDRQLDLPESHRVHDRDVSRESSPLPVPNPTLIPDRFLKTLSPVFIIRHPAKAFPSYLRVCSAYGGSVLDAAFPINASYKWQRLLYDSGLTNGNGHAHRVWPIVLNGDDLIVNAEDVMQKLCRQAGLDPSQICYTWDAEKSSSQDAISQALWSQVQSSTGIIKDPVSLSIFSEMGLVFF
ncbi:hypothetical protein K435DRAFT_677032 [Dendrothele bispora CBS 962.96]|uniref:P-loop containing nucleoside triphosphate hydrolase protein n=1 Tax=Dendrothele bispora (strain CBS 962.96) TaxID=1314807 RepID=A0A4S8LKX3_DENBC|nr:hypothetical protein K435DRAFT_677032 [Dendrothele bispora CBS 962.96]